jgi:N-carbamoyl-L-amino-acid hydrolase
MTLTIAQLNAAVPAEAVALLDGIYEHSPWIAQRALPARPFRSLAHLKHALVRALAASTPEEQVGLIRAHPELAGKAMVSKTLTAESTNEQSKAGLTDCTPRACASARSSTPSSGACSTILNSNSAKRCATSTASPRSA